MRCPHLPVCRSCQNSQDIKTARKYSYCQFHKGFQKEKHTAIAHSSNLRKLNILIMTMLRLLLLTLLLTVKADKPEHEASGNGFDSDDEEQEDRQEKIPDNRFAAEVKNVPDDAETEDGSTMIIIIAAVCVVALAIVTVIAVVLFKLHLQRREQGVYSVPVEQGQKGV